jgi:hypothetical protein
MPTADERLSYGFSTSFLNKNKSIRSLVDKAIDQGWTSQRFLDELRKTSWWKGRSDAQKQYDILRAENPGEWQRQAREARSKVISMATRLGVSLGGQGSLDIAHAWLRNGLSESEVREMIGRKYSYVAGKRGTTGVGATARAALNEMSRAYGMKVSSSWLQGAARQVAMGVKEVSDYEGYFRDSAARRFKSIANDIAEGRTVREILDPYLQTAAEELGIPVSVIDTTWGKWQTPIAGKEELTMDEWIKTIRTDKAYGYDQSQNAQRQASILAGQLMSRMGAQ